MGPATRPNIWSVSPLLQVSKYLLRPVGAVSRNNSMARKERKARAKAAWVPVGCASAVVMEPRDVSCQIIRRWPQHLDLQRFVGPETSLNYIAYGPSEFLVSSCIPSAIAQT